MSGGNTLYACDRFRKVGLVPILRAAAHRGCVLAGGSAGAICWFDGGHSDSMDPAYYRDALVNGRSAGAIECGAVGTPSKSASFRILALIDCCRLVWTLQRRHRQPGSTSGFLALAFYLGSFVPILIVFSQMVCRVVVRLF